MWQTPVGGSLAGTLHCPHSSDEVPMGADDILYLVGPQRLGIIQSNAISDALSSKGFSLVTLGP